MNRNDLSTISFDKLIQLRCAHQTKQAVTGVQKKTNESHVQVTLDATQVGKDRRKQEMERQSLKLQYQTRCDKTTTGVHVF